MGCHWSNRWCGRANLLMDDLFNQHGRAALLFSAGKDSLATLLLLKPYWPQIEVVWANPGAPYQETLDYMKGIERLVPNFTQLDGDQPEWITEHGWPVDVVPAKQTTVGEMGAGPAEIKFQPYFTCCSNNMWLPIERHIKASQHTLVITGQRKQETMRNRARDQVIQSIDGVDYFQPLNDWSQRKVFQFIASQGFDLPPGYSNGEASSSDCWNCTAYLNHNQIRLQNMKLNDGKRWDVISPIFIHAQNAIDKHSQLLNQLLK